MKRWSVLALLAVASCCLPPKHDPEKAAREAAALDAKVKKMRERDEIAHLHDESDVTPPSPLPSATPPARQTADPEIVKMNAKPIAARKRFAAQWAAKYNNKIRVDADGDLADELFVDNGACPQVVLHAFRDSDNGVEARRLGFRTYRITCGDRHFCVIQLQTPKNEFSCE